jgi:hypothetical protein
VEKRERGRERVMAEASEAKRAKRSDPQLAEFEKWCGEKGIKISPKVGTCAQVSETAETFKNF